MPVDPKPTPPSTVSTPATAKPAPVAAPAPKPAPVEAPAPKSLIDQMDDKRDEIARRQAFLDKAKAELDALIQKNNLNK